VNFLLGCGKTMLAKAVARHTTGEKILFNTLLISFLSGFFLAAFIRVVGSEFVQKYLGEGPRMVRDVFRLAKGMNSLLIDEMIH